MIALLGFAACRQAADPGDNTATSARAAPVSPEATASAAPVATASAPPAPPAEEARAPEGTVVERLRMNGLEPEAVQRFLGGLKELAAKGDRDRICGLLSYPLTAHVKLTTPAACVREYDRLFTAAVARAIGAQRFADLLVTSRGVMIGRGEVWFAGICDDAACKHVDLRITAINR